MSGSTEMIETWWDMPTGYPIRNFHTQNISRFTRNVEKAANERLRINLHPDGSLFAVPQILPAVKSGKAQLGELIMASLTQAMPVLGIDSIPFLTHGYEDARALWRLSRPLIQREFDKHHLVMLFAVPWPPQGLYVNRALAHIGDLRGLRLRSYDHVTACLAEQVGALGVNVQAATLPQAMASGKIDAMWTSSATGVDIGAWNRFGFYYDLSAWIPKNVVFMNKRAFESTDPRLQEAIREAAAEAEDRGWKTSQLKDKVFKDELASRGVEVLMPGERLQDGLQAIGERLAGQWYQLAGTEGAEVIDEFRRGWGVGVGNPVFVPTSIRSSATPVADGAAELGEFEFGLIIAVNAFNRWIVRCMMAAGMKDVTVIDVLVLHHVNHRGRQKKLADIAFILNIEDTHIVNYSLKKLVSFDLVNAQRRGKEVLYSTSEAGKKLCRQYFEVRERALVSGLTGDGTEHVELSELARFLRSLSGLYDQAARAATSL